MPLLFTEMRGVATRYTVAGGKRIDVAEILVTGPRCACDVGTRKGFEGVILFYRD
jgi:hypothetical protein